MFLNIELGFNKTQSSERESGFAVIMLHQFVC